MDRKKSGGAEKPLVFLILLLFLVLLFPSGCGKKENTPPMEEEYFALLSELDPDTLGAGIQKLSEFAKKYEEYKISEQAIYKIKTLKSKIRENYLRARDITRAREFDKGEKILTDIATHFPDSLEGEQARAFLNFEFPMNKAQSLLIQSKMSEAEEVLRDLRKESLTPDQTEIVEKMLDGMARNIEGRKRQYDAKARSVGRNAKLAQEVYYNDRESVRGAYTSDLNDLLGVAKNLADDPNITFRFLHGSEKGFTFFTTHSEGTGRTFQYHD